MPTTALLLESPGWPRVDLSPRPILTAEQQPEALTTGDLKSSSRSQRPVVPAAELPDRHIESGVITAMGTLVAPTG